MRQNQGYEDGGTAHTRTRTRTRAHTPALPCILQPHVDGVFLLEGMEVAGVELVVVGKAGVVRVPPSQNC